MFAKKKTVLLLLFVVKQPMEYQHLTPATTPFILQTPVTQLVASCSLLIVSMVVVVSMVCCFNVVSNNTTGCLLLPFDTVVSMVVVVSMLCCFNVVSMVCCFNSVSMVVLLFCPQKLLFQRLFNGCWSIVVWL